MLFTQIDDDKTTYGKITSNEMATLITNNLNYLLNSCPVGSIIPILYGLTGVPAPDSSIWQICDGGLIDNIDSPMNGLHAPNMRITGYYLKGADIPSEAGNEAGTRDKSFPHNHTGFTNQARWAPTEIMYAFTGGDDGLAFNDLHSHTIPTDSTSISNFEPSCIVVTYYIKIR